MCLSLAFSYYNLPYTSALLKVFEEKLKKEEAYKHCGKKLSICGFIPVFCIYDSKSWSCKSQKKNQAVLLDHKTVFLHIFVISWLRNIEKMRSWGLLPTRFLAEAKIPDQNMLVSFVHFVTYLLYVMAILVVEFLRKGYKIEKVFG